MSPGVLFVCDPCWQEITRDLEAEMEETCLGSLLERKKCARCGRFVRFDGMHQGREAALIALPAWSKVRA